MKEVLIFMMSFILPLSLCSCVPQSDSPEASTEISASQPNENLEPGKESLSRGPIASGPITGGEHGWPELCFG